MKDTNLTLLVVGMLLATGAWNWAESTALWDISLRFLGLMFLVYSIANNRHTSR
ncbi:MAG TPA: hypothetical protein VJB98_01425 [Candidatus Paceibacterota bacterium]